MSPFVEYSCGCVGIPTSPEGWGIVVQVCNGDGDDIGFHLRDMKDKTHKPLDESHAISPGSRPDEKYIRAVRDLIGGGYRFRDMKRLLGIGP